VLVKVQATVKPLGVWHRTKHEKHVRHGACMLLSGLAIDPAYSLQMSIALQRRNLGLRVERDPGRALDAIDQVFRHARREAVTSNEHMHVLGMARQKHRRLARGVAAADHNDLFVFAKSRLDRSRRVVDARSRESLKVFAL
jgi:hypothetical protein